jgi:phosphatidylserine/phosphatidylglycerophosphate/cardiolipin synthase-like enzyme
MDVTEWFLSDDERGNPATRIDRRRADGRAWTEGNEVTALVHGATYFAELRKSLEQASRDDLVLFTDWRGDPDEKLDASGITIGQALCRAASRGAVVRGLIWRSHLDRLSFSEQENRHLGEEIEAAGGRCLLDQRVRPGGSHHQKLVVVRYHDRLEMDVAYVGGIDLCHSRRDDAVHHGDRQRQPMAKVYGATPPWHDVQLAVRGPAVADVETVFRERWNDGTPLSRNPINRISTRIHHDDERAAPLPDRLPDPQPRGHTRVQLLRTYPDRGHAGRYPFAPRGERSVARGYNKVVGRAHSLIYVEDQYLWSTEVVACFADALRRTPTLHLIAVIPRYPDQDGWLASPPNLIGRIDAIAALRRAASDRVAIYSPENHGGTPVYVHAKVCVIDDLWCSIGSDNINRRSWTHDSELSCALIDDERDRRPPEVVDADGHGARRFARELRLQLAREHLDRAPGDDAGLLEPVEAFRVFADSAAGLQGWYDGGRRGPRPPGRLRPYPVPHLPLAVRAWARPLYRSIFDPDGRPRKLRRAHRY